MIIVAKVVVGTSDRTIGFGVRNYRGILFGCNSFAVLNAALMSSFITLS